MRDGSAVFTAGGQCVMGTSTGSNMNFGPQATNQSEQSGNSCEIAYAQVGSTAAADVAVTLTFE